MMYVIFWRRKSDGRCGKGTKQFTLQQATALADNLNKEFPQFLHSVLPAI